MTQQANLLYVVTEDYNSDERPVVLAMLRGDGDTYNVRTDWLPWASKRDKVTASLSFVVALRDIFTLIFIVEDGAILAQHMGRYGVLRKIGEIKDYNGSDVTMWQSKKTR